MKLLLIRHGQTEWNLQKRIQGWQDSALTSSGVEQLNCIPIPVLNNPQVFSSDLGRAYKSATIIAKRLSTYVVTDDRLRERRFGQLEGKVIDQDLCLRTHWNAYHQRYVRKITTIFGVESETLFEDRIFDFLSDRVNINSDVDMVIVSHGEWLRAFLNVIKGVPSWHCGQGINTNAGMTIINWSSSTIAQGNEKVC
ncbi:histidine phosphatase family protein [Vibrio sp. DW001]|uniref:histidine phosphatase family protein n=1 Tax=Vibrio sp. DW001 TaxID=2912315 RepID=UPI0023B1BA64|nr:histidine phosphatase family protein [Vibrio sp. DW001]WED28727.1 histidine phosphatase family protein [Vibrio sp. DW001]